MPTLHLGVGSKNLIHHRPEKRSCTRQTEPLFSELRHLVISNYLDWVNEPKHFIKQCIFFFLFLCYCIYCFPTTTLILKCFCWHCASQRRNNLDESRYMPITTIGLFYKQQNFCSTGISHSSSYHQASTALRSVCTVTVQGFCIQKLCWADLEIEGGRALCQINRLFFSCNRK